MNLVSSLHSQDALDFEIRTLPWRFDLLQDADWRDLASADALKSDLLIISTFSSANLPAAVWKWLAECLALKRGESAAVVALFGADGHMDHANSSRLQMLRSATHEAGLEFFAPSPGMDSSLNSIRSATLIHAEFFSSSIDTNLYPGVFNRDWGLNE